MLDDPTRTKVREHPRTVSHTAACPRCGYDLSGEVTRWADSCPLEGTCPECGSRFSWRWVIRPQIRTPRPSFEHYRGLKALRWTWREMLMNRWWRRVDPLDPIRWRRLLVVALCPLLVGHLVVSVVVGVMAAAIAHSELFLNGAVPSWWYGSDVTVQALAAATLPYLWLHTSAQWIGGPIELWLCAIPLSFAVATGALPVLITLLRSDGGPGVWHSVRVVCYTAPIMALLGFLGLAAGVLLAFAAQLTYTVPIGNQPWYMPMVWRLRYIESWFVLALLGAWLLGFLWIGAQWWAALGYLRIRPRWLAILLWLGAMGAGILGMVAYVYWMAA